jgi:hypothetical protein
MAAFELNIYGKDDEISKTYATDKVRWGVFLQALEVQESLATKTPAEQFDTINRFVKKIFPDLTDKDLENADINDVMNIFKQLLNKASKIGGNSKNAIGVE